jgi:septum formation protein
VVLASASPRRRELLQRLLPDFIVVPSGIEEVLGPGPLPDAVAAVALAKAREVARRVRRGVVLGADTVVVIDGEALGKPADAGVAREMLRRLRGRAHEVVTGVAVVDASTGRSETTAVVTHVVMGDVADAALDAYAASGEPLDRPAATRSRAEGRRWWPASPAPTATWWGCR